MAGDFVFEPVIGAEVQTRGVDAVIAAIAARQHGLVSRLQLLSAGIGRRAIGHRLATGRLHVIYRGVYAVGHRVLSVQGRWMAAVLSAGPDAVLSHHAAAAHWKLRPSSRLRVDVTVPRVLRPRPSLLPHCAVLPSDERTTHDGIPTTTVPRTLLDLAADLPRQAVQRAMTEADVLRLTDPLSLGDLTARHPHARGISKLRDHLPILTREELEHRFFAFLDAAVLPRPKVNTIIEGLEVDFAWPAHHLIVELDGYATHGTRHAFENDRARDRRLQVAGWRVARVTWRQLHDQPGALAAELRSLVS